MDFVWKNVPGSGSNVLEGIPVDPFYIDILIWWKSGYNYHVGIFLWFGGKCVCQIVWSKTMNNFPHLIKDINIIALVNTHKVEFIQQVFGMAP